MSLSAPHNSDMKKFSLSLRTKKEESSAIEANGARETIVSGAKKTVASGAKRAMVIGTRKTVANGAK